MENMTFDEALGVVTDLAHKAGAEAECCDCADCLESWKSFIKAHEAFVKAFGPKGGL